VSETTTAETSTTTPDAGITTGGETLITAPEAAAPASADAGTATADAAKGAEGEQQAAQPAQADVPFEPRVPEGMTLDTAAVSEFQALVKEAGLSHEAAQKVADIAIGMQTRMAEQHRTTVASWAEQARADKEIGGEQLPEQLGFARRALDQFGTPELRRVLDESGLGNHPELIRVMARAGKALADDAFIAGRTTGPVKTLEQKLYPTMN